MSQNRDDEARRAWDGWTEDDGTTEVDHLMRLRRMATERTGKVKIVFCDAKSCTAPVEGEFKVSQ